jgi:hypothetical protein
MRIVSFGREFNLAHSLMAFCCPRRSSRLQFETQTVAFSHIFECKGSMYRGVESKFMMFRECLFTGTGTVPVGTGLNFVWIGA